MTILEIVLYVLGASLGAYAGMKVTKSLVQIALCSLLWPIFAIASAAGFLAGYIQYRKERKMED